MAAENRAAVEEVRETAAEAKKSVDEVKDETEEVRVLAEKARDVADRSADDVAALQADGDDLREVANLDLSELSSEIKRLQADFDSASSRVSSARAAIAEEVDERVIAAATETSEQLRAEVNLSSEAMHRHVREETEALREETAALRREIEERPVESAPVAEIQALREETAALRREIEERSVDSTPDEIADMQRQLHDMRIRLETLPLRGGDVEPMADTGSRRSSKRWAAHLDLSPKPEIRSLPAAEESKDPQ